MFFEDAGAGRVEFLDENGAVVPEGHPDFDDLVVTSRYVVDDMNNLRNITARNFELSAAILDNAYNIAAASSKIGVAGSAVPIELQRHNNENMKELYALFGRTNFTLPWRDIGGFNEYATSIRFDVGSTLNTAKQAAETSRILRLAADNQRTAVAGVSLDEEMVGLVKFNHAYNGAARVITQMDDALDRLINGTGRVGL